MNPAQFLRSQIGRPAKRRRSLSMLLTATELPGSGWRTLGEVATRMGMHNTLGDISRRCRESGEYMALRRFRQDDPPRGLFLQVGPYPSQADAAQAISILGTSDSGMRWEGVNRLAERTGTGIDVPNVPDVRTWEYHTQRDELRGYQRFVQGRVENVVFVVSGSASEPGWAWDDLVTIGSAQARRIGDVLVSS